jgi:2-amino-4-hydroxy-6-hydroxymethyldihydropteridine diphosphokinase
MVVAYIGLGANLGDKRGNIRRALELLAGKQGIKVAEVSRLYRTAPQGIRDQPEFVNGAARMQTVLGPEQLLCELKQVERQLGRVSGLRNGPRVIDLDILLYSRLVMESRRLVIPHPRLALREFVLRPLAEIAGGACHPVLGRRIDTLWRELAGDIRNNGREHGKRK